MTQAVSAAFFGLRAANAAASRMKPARRAAAMRVRRVVGPKNRSSPYS